MTESDDSLPVSSMSAPPVRRSRTCAPQCAPLTTADTASKCSAGTRIESARGPERALKGAAPGDLFGQNLDEFARKGQLLLLEARLAGNLLANPELHGRDARALRFERLDFFAEHVKLALDAVLLADERLERRIPRLLHAGRARLFGGGRLHERAERLGRGRERFAELAGGRLDLAALAHRAVAVLFAAGLFGLPARDLIAAALAFPQLKVGERALLVDEFALNRAHGLLMPAALAFELRGLSREQVFAPRLAIGGKHFGEMVRAAAVCLCLLHFTEGGLGGREHANLRIGGHDGAVRRLKLDEFVDEAPRDRVGARLVEHEVSQKLVEVSEVLGRLRLVQKLERKIALDAEERREGGLIGREEVRALRVAQVLLEALEVVVGPSRSRK